MIKVNNLSGGYDNGFSLKEINFTVNKGEFFGIIGPNGSGKTTLVKMMSGILQSEAGTVTLFNRPLSDYRPKELAQKLAVLPQLTEQSFRFTVKETVALGRYAHQTGLFTSLSAYDEAIIEEVMRYTHIAKYANLTIDQLSGGERQRVFLAQALAQEPEVVILDEPTNHLDLAYQKQLLDLLNAWTVERELTVIAIFHDLNLASLYCDRLILMNNGRIHICDVPNEVIRHDHILNVYKTEVENHAHPVIPKLQVMLTPKQFINKEREILTENRLSKTDNEIIFQSPTPLKTVSTNPIDIGDGWYSKFINCHVKDKFMTRQERILEARRIVAERAFERTDSIVMFTQTNLAKLTYKRVDHEQFTLLVVVTADASQVVDCSKTIAYVNEESSEVGTINTWIFIDGKLADYVYAQAIVTATEAKTRALQEVAALDERTNSPATGNPTDNIIVAATQEHEVLPSATTTSHLGAHLAEAVYLCTLKSLQKTE